jgi:hypothetical protein
MFSMRSVTLLCNDDGSIVIFNLFPGTQELAPPTWGSLKVETGKYGHESRGTVTPDTQRW